MAYTQEQIEAAKGLYIKGWTPAEIAAQLKITARSIYNWIDKYGWVEYTAPQTPEQAMALRINALIAIDNKTDSQLAELNQLTKNFADLKTSMAQVERIKAEAYAIKKGIFIPPESAMTASDDKNSGAAAERKPRKRKPSKDKTPKNDISGITEEQLDEFRNSHFYQHQLLWHEKRSERTRFILKSRQIGATYYFAYEAFEDAVVNGKNQLFLSSSRAQAEVFKAYITAIAIEHFDVELKSSGPQGQINLSNGAEIRFLSTNSLTANSYNGNLYCDEIFYMRDFDALWDIASGMATHKRYRRTLFSVPSTTTHPAYKMWNGEKYNKGKRKDKRVEFDTSHKALKHGVKGADTYWRQIVTVEDAVETGFDMVDLEQLKAETEWEAFKNKYLCQFIDAAASVFKLAQLMKCTADSATFGYNKDALRPYGNKPVALGYDPSRTRDNADLEILSVPLKPGEKWRSLYGETLHGVNFKYQAQRIKEICETHNVVHIGIDVTGIGYGLFELVEQFYPNATPINYSVQTKSNLVVKAIQVISDGRFQYCSGDTEMTQAFMMITKTTTNGGQITYAANRNNTTGHADKAWAVMHALAYEDIAEQPATEVAISGD